MKLHEITANLQRLKDFLEDLDGELTPELEAQLDQLDGNLTAKVDGYCRLIRHFELEAAIVQSEIDRMEKLCQSRSKAAQRLKAWLKTNLERLGETKVDTELFRVRIQKNSRPSIAYTADLTTLPESFRKVTVALDGTAAYEAWKAGQELPAGFVVQQCSHLRIS